MRYLLGIPFMLVALALLWPLLALGGGTAYVACIAARPDLVVTAFGAWLLCLYWACRWIAQQLLVRLFGEKLQVLQ